MGDIRIKQVQIQNFLSIRAASLDFSNRGLVLVEGPNGVGKSALCVESLSYGLFGVSERYGRKRDEVINRFTGSDCRICIGLEVDEMSVVVDCYRKHKKYKDGVFLTINGEDKRGATNDQTWDKITKLLDLDYTGFTSSIVFGQSISQYFSGLSDADQKKVVERLLGITWIPQAYELSKGDREEYSSKLAIVEGDFQTYTKKLEELQEFSEGCRRKYKEFEEERKAKVEGLKKLFVEVKDTSNIERDVNKKEEDKIKLDKEFEELGIKIKALEKEIIKIDAEDERRMKIGGLKKLFVEIKESATIEKYVQEKEKEVEELNKESEELAGQIKGLEKNIDKVDAEISTGNRSVSSSNLKVKNFYESKIEFVCEKCGTINETSLNKYRSKLEEELETLRNEITVFIVKREGLVADLNLKSTKSSELYQMLKEFREDLRKLKLQLNGVILENARIEEKNLSITNQIKEIQNNKNVYSELAEEVFREEKNRMKIGSTFCNSKSSEISGKIKILEENLKELKSKLNSIVLENARIEEKNLSTFNQIKELQEGKNIYVELVEKTNVEIEKLKGLLEERRIESKKLRLEIEYHGFWEEGFSNRGLKSYIIESVIPQMNEYAGIYASALGGKYDISFSPQKQIKSGELREKFTPIVVNKFGSQIYEGNSNGERRAIDAAMMFVLGDLAASRNNKRFSLLILDDVFEKLDEEVCDSIIGVLRIMTSNNTEGLPRRESIFVLSHLEYFRSKFENRIKVERKNGETILREV